MLYQNTNREVKKGMKMKNILGSVLLLTGVYATASENYFQNAWDAKGLIALEGAFGTGQSKLTTDTSTSNAVRVEQSGNNAAFGGGLKLGGESENYRLFISARYHDVKTYDYVTTVGAEMQYLIRAGEHFNIFMGINGGGMGSQITDGAIEYTVWDPYAGADVGVNIDIIDNFGLELGGRVNKAFSDSSIKGSVNFLAEGYVSLVFKFTGEY